MEFFAYILLVVVGGIIGWFFGVSQALSVVSKNPEFFQKINENDLTPQPTKLTLTAEQHGNQWYLYQKNQFVGQGTSIENALLHASTRWDNDTHITVIKSDEPK